MSNVITIKALKYPGTLHYEWEGSVIEQTSDYILLLCEANRKLIHHTKGKIFTEPNVSIEYFSLKKWYTAAMKIESGEIIEYYCNVAKPSILKGNTLSFIDLDLDLLKSKDEAWRVVDEDEFEENRIKLKYPFELQKQARVALEQLKSRALKGNFPFNKDIIDLIK